MSDPHHSRRAAQAGGEEQDQGRAEEGQEGGRVVALAVQAGIQR
jgi:hypothetical protein